MPQLKANQLETISKLLDFGIGSKDIAVQDQAPAYKSRTTFDFFAQNNLTAHFQIANAPDINPIEACWSLLEDRITKRRPQTIAELEEVALEAWDDRTPLSFVQEQSLGSPTGAGKPY